MMVAAMITTIATELTFTLYVDVYGVLNILGHVLKILSFIFIYNALVRSSLIRPYETMFRQLEQEKRSVEISERQLNNTNAKQEALIKNISDVIGIIGVDGLMKFKSPNIEKWFGWKPEELIGKETWANVHADDLEQVQATFGAILQNDLAVATAEYRYLCKNGDYKWIEATATNLISDKNINGILLNYHDITERKQAEEALLESNSIRELLLDIITHDLRNPAGNIYALSEAARKDLPENKFLEAIYTSSGHLIEVFNQTTILSQATFGETIPKEPLSLNKLLQETVDEFASALSAAEMDLVVAISPDLIIEANPLIREVFKNYISNAIKYARDGKRIEIETIIEDQTVIVCVKDFGKTIAKADRDRIFERRAQLENGKEKGRGLGLAIVKRIAEAHDGEVWVEPNKPRGNSFGLRIPHLK